ncbi:MAG: hypothetical protein WC107_05955 [Patescibacteria group bacterium]
MGNKDLVDKIIKKQSTRIETTRTSHIWFFHTYFHSFVQYAMANFQREMFGITEDQRIKLAVICSFRGSGKSTLMTLSYPIWAILGRLQKKFVVIISQTQEQAGVHFKNLKTELETNELLKRDLGPFKEQDEWNSCSLILPKYNAKIIAVSREQAIRGIRFGRYRPDLIIADDIENMASVKTAESRKNTREWFTSEVLPLGDRDTKFVIVGNLLHQDSLIMSMKHDIENGKRSGVIKMFPLLSENNEIAWPGKYPDMKAIEQERMSVGDKFAWYREYLLRIIDDSEPVVSKDAIKYYDPLPTSLRNEPIEYAIGVDLAISQKDAADYTALVSAKIYGYGEKRRIYILPNTVNERMKINETQDVIKGLIGSYGGRYSTRIFVEDVMLQGWLTQLLHNDHYRAEGMKVGSMDKRSRLNICSSLIHSGEVLFPVNGCKELIEQITEFGTTTHDDLVDAFTTLIMMLIDKRDNNYGCMIIKAESAFAMNTGNRTPQSPSECRSRRDWAKFIDEETKSEFS